MFISFQRQAAAIVRALVVGSATLAILLICFSIYQYSQADREATEKAYRRRLPPVASKPPEHRPSPSGQSNGETVPGVAVSGAVIGRGRGTELSLYPPEGKKALCEISVREWTPVAGSANEFRLVEPEVRLRTNTGHGIRAVARKGSLEAERKTGGRLDLQRGRLTGDVVIEIDRLTDKERAELPEELRDKIDPSQIVRIETDEIVFDREYSKVIVPGPVHLSARDADVRAADVEIRFNEAAGRVEYCRINDGGRIELRQDTPEVAVEIPGMDATRRRRQTVVDWLRATLQARLAAREAAEKPDRPKPAGPTVTLTDDGIPVFRPDEEKEDEPEPEIKYFARFEGDVSARQLTGDLERSHLQADMLGILRDFSDRDRERVRAVSAPPTAPTEQMMPSPEERITVTWADRLLVEAVSPGDERHAIDVHSKMTASGSPVRLSNPEGEVTCARLTFTADDSAVSLYGTEADPAVVRMGDQGVLSGVEVHSHRSEDALYVRAVGPGFLVRGREGFEVQGPIGWAPPDAGSEYRAKPDSAIEFSNKLEVHGRIVTKTEIDLTGGISTREYRVVDSATFDGRAKMYEGDTALEADALTLTFGRKAGRETEQTIERVEGRGDVVMTQGADRLICREVDLTLTTDDDGKPVPLTATALGNVSAVQGERSIRARDRLIVDFEMVTRPAPPFDAAKAYSDALAAGLDGTQIDWEARRREHKAKQLREPGVKRLQAFGEVRIIDPTQSLDLTTEELDCTVVNGREIDKALIAGIEGRPASVRLDTFTVAGREIKLNLADQRADVPGEGRMTFRSLKDLDGRKVDEPIPISITWEKWMKYRGKNNKAVFAGNVHATSETTTTFDCSELLVEFEDVEPEPAASEPAPDWWILQDLFDRVALKEQDKGPTLAGDRFSKEPTYILATGRAVALTSEFDPSSGKLKNRARISGPRLSVDLRPEVSKMLIEGEGNLLLEDFRPAAPSAHSSGRVGPGLFSIDEDTGPSKTLIEWKELMWYDFANDQTRFEGQIELKHFSGSELERRFLADTGRTDRGGSGRATFLGCNALTVDFFQRGKRANRSGSQRMGRLSADRIRRFQAYGDVELQDPPIGLWLTAMQVIYEGDRNLLAIHGSQHRPARIIQRRPGEFPRDVKAKHFYYNTLTGKIEASGPIWQGR